jgi:hypothetical protein
MIKTIEPNLMTDALERRVTFNEVPTEEAGHARMALLNPSCNLDLLVHNPAYLVYLLDIEINQEPWQPAPFEENELRRGLTWGLLKEDYIPSGTFRFSKEQ